jgi:hypothetical protein
MIRIGEWVRVSGKKIGQYNFVGLVVGRGQIEGTCQHWLVFDRDHPQIITACERLLTLAPAPRELAGLPFAAVLMNNPIRVV